MLLVPLNLPQSLRSSARSVLLTGIIPGPAEVKNTDPYVDVLIDEILKLQNTPVYDALHDEEFNLQISITLNILDFPGQNKLFHCQGTCVLCRSTCIIVYNIIIMTLFLLLIIVTVYYSCLDRCRCLRRMCLLYN